MMRNKIFAILLTISVFSSAFGLAYAADAEVPKEEKNAGKNELPPLSDMEKKLMDGIGAKLNEQGDIVLDSAVISRRDKSISFPGYINIREGEIEILVSGEKGRTHESLIISKLDPFKLQLALILAGYRNGPIMEDAPIPMGSVFDITVRLPDGKIENIDDWLYNVDKETVKPKDGWVFVGSNFSGTECLASVEGNLININSNDENTIVNAKLNAGNINDRYDALTEKLPLPDPKELGKEELDPEDYITPVTVILRPRPEQEKESDEKKPAEISGTKTSDEKAGGTPAEK